MSLYNWHLFTSLVCVSCTLKYEYVHVILWADAAAYRYGELLTSYAAKLVKKQLQHHMLTDELLPVGTSQDFQVQSHEGLLTVSASACECLFRKATGLPCRHMFAARHILGLDLYDEGLCLQRWLLQICSATQRLVSAPSSSSIQ